MDGEKLDTRKPTRKLMLTILADVATRDHAGTPARGHRQSEGRGQYKGRPPSIDGAIIRELLARMGPADVAKTMGIARSAV